MLVAQSDCCVTGHEAAQFFLVDRGEQVVGNGGKTGQVGFGNVQSDELDVRIGGGAFCESFAERKARANDDVEAVSDGCVDHGDSFSGAVAGGLVVVELDTVRIGESLAGFIGSLVEAFVGDVAVVGDHGYGECGCSFAFTFAFGGRGFRCGFVAAGAGCHGEYHSQREEQRE